MGKEIKYDSLDYYKVLGVSPETPEEELRQKYRDMAKFWHPDHNNSPDAVDMFQKISAAYDVLKESQTRLAYTLLSIIYGKENFPDMNALLVLRNMHGQEDLNMRAFHLTEVTGKGLGHNKIDKIYYCSLYEAAGVIGRITRHNWLYGFWGISAFFVNIAAIIQNINHINARKENLNLLLHNALAYNTEGKKKEAATLAALARDYANKDEMPYLNQYLQMLSDYTPLGVRKWNFGKLKRIQLFYPFMLLIILFLIAGGLFLGKIEAENKNKVNVKEVVIFKNGQKVFSDVAVAKIFDIPVDVHDKLQLYHVTDTTQAMHGADRGFDVFATVERGTTVRLTGYTADKKWYRVMFDSGEMAFIEADKLAKGIGNEIPLWSKIYKE